jgi:hypothetical protein
MQGSAGFVLLKNRLNFDLFLFWLADGQNKPGKPCI